MHFSKALLRILVFWYLKLSILLPVSRKSFYYSTIFIVIGLVWSICDLFVPESFTWLKITEISTESIEDTPTKEQKKIRVFLLTKNHSLWIFQKLVPSWTHNDLWNRSWNLSTKLKRVERSDEGCEGIAYLSHVVCRLWRFLFRLCQSLLFVLQHHGQKPDLINREDLCIYELCLKFWI